MRPSRLLACFLALLAAGCARPSEPRPATASAKAGDPLPGPDEIARDYLAYSVSPLETRRLRFTVLVPRAWREEALLLDRATLLFDDIAFVPLARFVPPEDASSAAIEVSYLRLRRELELADFVEDYLRQQDAQVVSTTAARYNGEPAVDVVVAEGSRRGRLVFRKAGPVVFLASGSASEEEFPRHAGAFGAALVALAIPGEGREPFAEPVSLFEASRELALKIHKPDTWLASPVTGAPAGCGGVDIALKEDEAVRALLRLRWVDRTKAEPGVAEGLAETTWREFRAAGVHDVDFLGLGRLPEAGATSPVGEVGLWRGTVANHAVLMRAVTLEGEQRVFVVTLLGPARSESPELWATGAWFFAQVARDVAASLEPK